MSNLPGAPLGLHWRRVFRGSLAADFTLSGEWAEVFNDSSFRQGGPESGWVEFQIVIEASGGEEEIILRASAVRGDPYRAEELRLIPTPEWPNAPPAP